MILTEEQVDYIATNLEFYGIASDDLRADVLDHICTYIESCESDDFDAAYKDAIQQFGGYQAMGGIERDTYLMVSFRNTIRRQKILNTFGCLATVSIVAGVLFKSMHWPGANLLFFSGCVVLMLAFLPLFFYQRYKKFYKKAISQ